MKQNNPSARITDIVENHSRGLLAYIRRRVHSREDAEDILQEVFYQLSRSYLADGNDIQKVSGWLYRVAHNAILNQWRRERPTSLSSFSSDYSLESLSDMLFSSPDTEPDTICLRRIVWQEMEYALAELPAEQSEIFCLTVFEGIPVKEISTMTGVPVATLLSRKHYAVKHLRLRMRGLYEDLLNS